MSDKIAKMLATFFYVGHTPAAPGSLASIAGVVIYLFLYKLALLYFLLFLAVTIVGFMVSEQAEKLIGQKDPSCIVIDEVAGMMLALFLLPPSWPVILTTFFLFRAFDMFKIYPVNKFEDIKGGAGIMMDDLFAGLYTNIVMHIALRWAGFV